MQRADDVAAGVASTAQHQRLAVPADVGDELHAAAGGTHQGAAFAFLGQGVEVADVRHGQLVADVARSGGEQGLLFALEPGRIEIAPDFEL